MRFLERVADRNQNLCCPLDRKPPLHSQFVGQRTAFEQLHYQISDSLRGYPRIEYGYSVRVVDAASRDGFESESFESLCRIVAGTGLEDLHRNRPLHRKVGRPIDRSESTRTDLFIQLIFPVENCSGQRSGKSREDSIGSPVRFHQFFILSNKLSILSLCLLLRLFYLLQRGCQLIGSLYDLRFQHGGSALQSKKTIFHCAEPGT